MDEEQQRRVALEEARFRDLNERQVSAVAEFRDGGGDAALQVACECAVANCDQMVTVDEPRYRHVRSSGRWFLVLPGHVVEATEFVVDRGDDHWIVEKNPGLGAEVAEQQA